MELPIGYKDSVWQWRSKDGRSLDQLSWVEMKSAEAKDPSLRRHWTKSRRQRQANLLRTFRNPPSDVELWVERNGTGALVLRKR